MTVQNPPVEVPPSAAAMLLQNVERFGDAPFLHAMRNGRWEALTWREVEDRVRRTALGLIRFGLEFSERAAILSENRPEWLIADFGTQFAGAANAPIYTTNTPAQCAYVVRDSGARVCFVSKPDLLQKLQDAAEQMPDLELVVSFEPTDVEKIGKAEVITLEELWARGDAADSNEVERRLSRIGHDDLLTLIYTSGTTGEPKGVMLTHGNLCSNAASVGAEVYVGPEDIFLSFLPLSHSFERMAGHFVATYVGARIYYAESIERLLDNLADVRPTVMASVPRIYEKVYTKFMAQRDSATGAKRKIMDLAMATGYEASRRIQRGESLGLGLTARYALAKKMVFSKLSDKLGGRIRFCVSGGAPLSREVQEFFHAAGILVLEGYGLTETSPVLTCNRPEAFKFGTVGQPVPGVEIKIADDGEVLARGPSIMKGYYNKPDATKAVLLEDGWFATGDIGEIDDEGFLRITDRKKDLIKTAGGKYVAPQAIENLLKLQPHIEQACVIGDRRPYCVALVVPDFVALEEWAAEQGLRSTDPRDLVSDERVKKLIESQVAEVNKGLGAWESVKYFHVVADPFSQENNLLTPTLKVRRKAVMQVYAEDVDDLYRQGERRKADGFV